MCLQAFAEKYSEELQLNTAFNQFVSAYEDAYNGPNTRQHQLGVKNKYIRKKGEWYKCHSIYITDKVPPSKYNFTFPSLY